jgi:hypothetical protein
MTPKEKAKEIYCKYADALNIRDLQTNANPFAKQCALISVDEIIKAIDFDWMEVQNIEQQHRYWEEVKQEITNL